MSCMHKPTWLRETINYLYMISNSETSYPARDTLPSPQKIDRAFVLATSLNGLSLDFWYEIIISSRTNNSNWNIVSTQLGLNILNTRSIVYYSHPEKLTFHHESTATHYSLRQQNDEVAVLGKQPRRCRKWALSFLSTTDRFWLLVESSLASSWRVTLFSIKDNANRTQGAIFLHLDVFS